MNFEAKEGFAGTDAAEQKYQTLKMAIGSLAPFDRHVLQLRWADDLTRHETATVLQREPASVLAAEIACAIGCANKLKSLNSPSFE